MIQMKTVNNMQSEIYGEWKNNDNTVIVFKVPLNDTKMGK